MWLTNPSIGNRVAKIRQRMLLWNDTAQEEGGDGGLVPAPCPVPGLKWAGSFPWEAGSSVGPGFTWSGVTWHRDVCGGPKQDSCGCTLQPPTSNSQRGAREQQRGDKLPDCFYIHLITSAEGKARSQAGSNPAVIPLTLK